MKRSYRDNSLNIETVQQKFEAWRAGRTRREAIPETLWESAVRLCEHFPLSRVSRILRLSFRGLKKRVESPRVLPVQFTELDLGCLGGSWQIECQRPDGARLRVSSSGQPPALGSLLGEFLA